ncbi:unnamed protein product, partial [Heligmosomoides polygyrus]|uniref:Ras-related protein Rab-39B n=1 Tax=Heligmosomoides polygyrus TaxID=6339 RepID=A0A183FA98_HELPZ
NWAIFHHFLSLISWGIIPKCSRISVVVPTPSRDRQPCIIMPQSSTFIALFIYCYGALSLFRSITRSYYRNSVGVMLVYDISNRASFENISSWLHEAESNMGGPNPGKCVFQLVGHKSDDHSERRVDYEEGEYFAKYHRMKFIETSAITGKNVFDAFLMMAQEVYKRVEEGFLRPTDGWEGVKGGLMRSQSISLSEKDFVQKDQSCAC